VVSVVTDHRIDGRIASQIYTASCSVQEQSCVRVRPKQGRQPILVVIGEGRHGIARGCSEN
jgi:hypothetical protein